MREKDPEEIVPIILNPEKSDRKVYIGKDLDPQYTIPDHLVSKAE